MHGSHKGQLKTWMYVTPPLAIYAVDRLVRLLREKGSRLSITRESAVLKGTDMVCLRIPRTFSYLAGQYCDLKVPMVSQLEWHPFTIASSPHESEMLFYIKVNGDWTRKLYALFKERDGEHEDVNIHVRGPYGAPAQHVGQYEHVVLISGGVGATPFASITKYAHHWILNFTERGQEASKTVSAAFTRNQSVQGTPSAPGTPRNPGSGYASGQRSRHMSRNVSGKNFGRSISRNISRSGSRNGSRPLSRSGSGREHGRYISRSGSGRVSRPMSRSGSGRLERFNSRPLSRAESGRGDRFNGSRGNSGRMLDRNSSGQTADSVGIIIQEQRMHQPYGPNGPASLNSMPSPLSRGEMALTIPGSDRKGDDYEMQKFLAAEAEIVEDEYDRPDDYDEDLGNPVAPVPDRRAITNEAVSPSSPGAFEVVKEYDSSQGLFDDDEEEIQVPPADLVGTGELDDSAFDLHHIDDLETGGIELEDQILREQHAGSNAYNMLGMSFGPIAMMRHMRAMDAKKSRTSAVRASMNLMDDAMDATVWQDRVAFYLHTVTLNWVLLWLMLTRYAIVWIASIATNFSISHEGFGIFETEALNGIDLVLAIIIAVPMVGTVVMEIVVTGVAAYVSDGIGNSFDLFVLVPLLLSCIVFHVLGFANVGEDVPHISKLIVFVIWPVVAMFILWRVGRTIGSRVTLAQYLKSSHAQTKALDYIWVSKTHEDDTWLIDEMLPLAGSNIVRLHRFITRHGPKTEPWMLDYEKIPLKTTYSRPDWDDVFANVVERSKSGSVVGVFFCGPDSMARMVQQAARKAMGKSLQNGYQRGYDGSKGGEERGGDRDLRKRNNASSGKVEGAHDPAAYGCGVRIHVRIENFT